MRDITLCHPRLQSLAAELIKECAKQGLQIKIGETLRTTAEQDALYAQGRTKPGSIITNAKGSSYSSYHQWGTAFDFYRADGCGAYYDSDGFFSKVGAIGVSLGLEWGGNWKSIVDKPHFQLPDWGSSTSGIKKKFKTPEEFMKTWPKEEKKTIIAGWQHDANGWWWQNADGSYPKNKWEELEWNGEKHWYYFGSAGYMLHDDWKQSDGRWYYLGSDGAMLTSCIQVIGKEIFVFGQDGGMLEGEIQVRTNDRGAITL